MNEWDINKNSFFVSVTMLFGGIHPLQQSEVPIIGIQICYYTFRAINDNLFGNKHYVQKFLGLKNNLVDRNGEEILWM